MENYDPHLLFLDISQKYRKQFVSDVMEENPDLYLALYKDIGSELYHTALKIYEFSWLEAHWKEIIKILERKHLSALKKRELIELCAGWYKQLIEQWNYSKYDTEFFADAKQFLHSLILQNTSWEQDSKRMRVFFEKTKKIFKDDMRKAEEEMKYERTTDD